MHTHIHVHTHTGHTHTYKGTKTGDKSDAQGKTCVECQKPYKERNKTCSSSRGFYPVWDDTKCSPAVKKDLVSRKKIRSQPDDTAYIGYKQGLARFCIRV